MRSWDTRSVVELPEEGASRVEERGGLRAAAVRLSPSAIVELANTLRETPGPSLLAALPGVRFVVASDKHFAELRYPF